MKRKYRPKDHNFDSNEQLYRRVRPQKNSKRFKKKIGQYSLALPDMSAVRSKYGGKPEFALYDVVHEVYYSDWGIVSLAVADIPPEISCQGVRYSVKCRHVPLQMNYQHSEVWVYDSSDKHLEANVDLPVGLVQAFQSRLHPIVRIERLPS